MRALAVFFAAVGLFLAGCSGGNKPTEFKGEHKDHVHELGKMQLEDIELPGGLGRAHAALTAHLSQKEGNELDVLFKTMDEKDPKPIALPASAKVTARATRPGDEKDYKLEFEPAPKEERKDDPEGKCSHYSAKAPWMKPDDQLTVVLTVEIDGTIKKCTWTTFNPKKHAHVDE
jgi:hypothetical protein